MTPAADMILEDRGVLVLPDVLANAGGVVVSYFEWVQGLQEYFWREDEVNAKLHDIVARAFEDTWQTRERIGDEHAHGRLWDRRAARRGGDDDEGPVPVARVTLYRAAQCHLCERALEVLREAQAELGFELQLVEIDGDAELEPGTGSASRSSRSTASRRSPTSSNRTRSASAWRFIRRGKGGHWQNRDDLSQGR